MKATIYYSAPGVTGRCEINTDRFFPCRKSDLTALKKKVVDLHWNADVRRRFWIDLVEGVKDVRGRVLVDQRYFLEQVRDGQLAKSVQEKKLAHFRRMLKDLDMDQEVVESWLQEQN